MNGDLQKWARTSLAAAAVAGLALTGTAAYASTSVAPPGATRVQANNNGWSGMSYRPGYVIIGNGGAPGVNHLSWGSWASSAASTSRGTITQQFPCGLPTYQCPAYSHPVKVYLHDRLTHSGRPYFAKMRWNWVNAKEKARVAYWLFTNRGGTVPGWEPRG